MQKVTDPNILAQLNGGSQQPRSGPVYGPPPAPVDPMDVRKDNLEVQGKELDIETKKLTLEEKRLAQQQADLGAKLGKEAGFYLRAASAGPAYEALEIGPEGQFRASVDGIVPDNWLNQFTGEQRQVAEAYMRDFAMASLRYESGAAIPPEEIKSQIRTFFPVAGDSEATVKAKAQLRRNLIQSLRLGAGPEAAQQVDEYLATLTQEPEAGAEVDERTAAFLDQDDDKLRGVVTDTSPNPEIQALYNERLGIAGEPGIMDLAKSGITLGLIDEASGVGEAISGALQGDFDVAGNYQKGRDVERMRLEKARQQNGAVGTAAELAGGAGSIASKAGAAFGAARQAAQAGNLSRQGVQQQMVRNATIEGGGVGALGGFGYGEGFEGSTSNALVGMAGGAVVGRYGQKAGNALANRANVRQADHVSAAELARAGRAEGVTVNRAMIDRNSNNAVTKADASIVGGRKIQREMENVEGQLEDRVRSLGNGRAPEKEAVGAMAQGATQRHTKGLRGEASRLYEKADDIAGGARVDTTSAVRSIDENLAELKASGENANRGLIKYLTDLRDDMANGMTVRGLRDLRTNMRGQIKERNLDKTDAERRIGQVVDAASDDIASALPPQARAIYGRADKIWREQADFSKQVRDTLTGPANNPKSGKQAGDKLESLVRDDAPRFKRLWDSLDDAERGELRGYFAHKLGTDSKNNFSPAIFLNNLPGGKTQTISERTARIMFGEEGAQSLTNLKRIAEEVNRVTSAMNSRTSKSGVASYRDWMWSLMAGGGGAITGGGTEAVAMAGGVAAATAAKQFFTARSLMSPKVQKWLLSTPRTQDPKAINAHFDRLGNIAKTEPALAQEIEILRNGIMRAANDNSRASLVAEDGVEEQ